MSLKERLDNWTRSKWAKALRITGSVFWNLALIVLVLFLVLGAFGASVGAGYFAALVKDEPLRSPEQMKNAVFTYEETSEIYFKDNNYFGKMRTDLERTETKLDAVSENVLNAVFATEDEYFEVHDGIVPKAVLRGLVQDITNADTQTGGSTLTQQIIKNQILTNEVSYSRKAKELLLAMRLEEYMGKDEILEAYLNIIPYGRNSSGRNIAGIETAAQGIFGVEAKDLNLAQAAYIAGIPQAPYRYTPFTSKGELKDAEGLQPGIDRMKTVLFRMNETEYITDAEYQEALAYDITKDFKPREASTYEDLPWLTIEVEERVTTIMAKILAERDGLDPDRVDGDSSLRTEYRQLARQEIATGGYRIHTTIDEGLMRKMEEIKDSYDMYGYTRVKEVKNEETGEIETVEEPVQVGGMLLENQTGRILAFMGGRDHNLEALNHSTTAFRSPGSTFKPLMVYAPAIEYGLVGAGSPVVDVKFSLTDASNSGWEPSNYNPNQEKGIISVRSALTTSQNLTAVRLYDEVKQRQPIDLLHKMGFSSVEKKENDYPSISIGGTTTGVTIEDNTNAFSMFANNGSFVDAYLIEKIEDVDGNVVFEHKAEPVQVFSPATSYIMNDMMRDVFDEGTATVANSRLKFNSDFAGKTGTTQDHKDSWLIGYNPNVTLSVWLGYDNYNFKAGDNTLFYMNNTYGHPSVRSNTLWANIMNGLYDVNPELIAAPNKTFQRPEGVVERSFCSISGLAPSSACSNAGLVRSDLFNAAAFLPTKPDDSLVSSSYVTINGNRYRALESTPQEFVVRGGFGVSESFIERMLGRFGGNASKLFPENSGFASNVVSEDVFQADDAAPSGVTASVSGDVMTWTDSGSADVVGYYIYQGSTRIAAVPQASANRYTLGGFGDYSVRAVDITGKQSAPSNAITRERPEPEPAPTPTPTTPPATGGGDGGGNSGGGNSGGGNSGGGNSGGGNGGGTGGGDDTDPVDPVEPEEPEEPEEGTE
ncbi:transglycosylase domain-containing protein [Chryseomicrobium aureum]|uniref:transglycosylase domain-containing protein n=1 Tax=Chryseomicrobium aureum TaxID=1441723 RepID=UPI00370D6E6E